MTPQPAYFFEPYGPYAIRRTGRQCQAAQPELWEAAEDEGDGLSRGIGCYLFCIRHGKKITPWYVGMTVAEAGFRGEAFQPHKIDIYNECLHDRKGVPVMYFFSLQTTKGKFSHASRSKRGVIAWLEKILIGLAYAQNPAMGNTKEMHYLRNTTVDGLLGRKRKGPISETIIDVRSALLGRKTLPPSETVTA